LRYILREDGNDAHAAPVCGDHHPQGLILAHAKLRLQNHDDELARRIVIVHQNDFVETGPFGLYLIFGVGPGDDVIHRRTVPD
jgi:hypothetical protein